jgi:hypothetical protein
VARKKRVFPLTFAYMKKDTLWKEMVGKKWLSYHDKTGALLSRHKDYWDKEAQRDLKRFERAWKKQEEKERKWYSRENW